MSHGALAGVPDRQHADDRRRVHPARLEVAVFVVGELDVPVERDFDAARRAADVPRIAGEKPIVGVLDLIAVRERLAEEPEFIVDAVADRRQVERRERIEEARGETTETAVAETHVLFLFENRFRIEPEFAHRGFRGFEQAGARKIVAQQAAHQVFDRKIVAAARLRGDMRGLRVDEAVVNQVADRAAHGKEPIVRRRRVLVAGERAAQMVENPLLERIDVRLRGDRRKFRLSRMRRRRRFFGLRYFCHYVLFTFTVLLKFK